MQQFATGRITDSEREEMQLLLAMPDQEQLMQAVTEYLEQESNTPVSVSSEVVQSTFDRIMAVDKEDAGRVIDTRPPVHRVHFLRKWRWAAAAVLLLLAGATFYWWKDNNKGAVTAKNEGKPAAVDVAPGRNGAVLVLADGKRVVLDSMGTGLIASQNGTKVVLKEDQLVYDATASKPGETTYNTISTPNGRQFRLSLPDGTNVWLNAASSIHYPTQFAGNQRKVEITGEVYFEVTKNPAMPFKVGMSHGEEVEVLGTHFNINAYRGDDNKTMKTTLLEGSVRVTSAPIAGTKDQPSAMLKPGQQAVISTKSNKSPQILVQTADIDKVMAWKNGFFNFEGMQLREVMQQLERWYDIHVVYEGNVPDLRFYGELRRDMNLSGIIAALNDSGVHFRIEDNKLIVLP